MGSERMSFDELVTAIGQAHAMGSDKVPTPSAQTALPAGHVHRRSPVGRYRPVWCQPERTGAGPRLVARRTGGGMGPFASRQVIGQQAVAPIAQQPATQLLGIPWGHHLASEALRGQLPSIEQLERELGLGVDDGDEAEAGGAGV